MLLVQMGVDGKSTAGLPSMSRVVGMLEAATAGVTLLAAAAPGPAVKSGVSEELLEVVATCLQSALRKVGGLRRR